MDTAQCLDILSLGSGSLDKRIPLWEAKLRIQGRRETFRKPAASVCVCMNTQPLSCVWLFVTPWMQPARLLCPWDFPSKNTRVGCHALLQGIFPTQGLNPHLLGLLQLAGGFFATEPPGKPQPLYRRLLEKGAPHPKVHINIFTHL